MSEQGVFAVHRGVFSHVAFAAEPFTEREAWLWLISAAAWKAMKVRVGRQVFSLDRGQAAFSIRFLAEKWKWTKSRVQRFLKRLKNEAMITLLPGRDATQITICNYNKYSFGRDTVDTQIDTPHDTLAGRSRDKEEELNNSKEKKELRKGASAEAELPLISPAKAVFNEGRKYLEANGMTEANARSLLGRWKKNYSDSAIIDAITAAQREEAENPVAFITKSLEARHGNRRFNGSQNRHSRAAETAVGVAAAFGFDVGDGSGPGRNDEEIPVGRHQLDLTASRRSD